jgi:hypothetical protein
MESLHILLTFVCPCVLCVACGRIIFVNRPNAYKSVRPLSVEEGLLEIYYLIYL